MDEIHLNSLAYLGTPESRNEKSSYLQRSLRKNSFNQSIARTPNMRDLDISSVYPFQRSNMRIDTTLGSGISNISGIYELSMDVDDSNKIEMLYDAEGGRLATNLYQEFYDLYASFPGEHEAFELLHHYEELCLNTAKSFKPLLQKSAPSQQRYASSVIHELRLEKNTWRLARTLYKDRIEESTVDEDEILLETLGKIMSDKQLVENFFARNSTVRQCQLVVDWLEKNASDDFVEEYQEKLNCFAEQSNVSWEHTLHDLTMKNPLECPTRDSLITELDPDAPIRQRNNVLHAEDREIESRLLKIMFLYLRCGNLDEAQKIAENFGYPWLAASLEGWRLYHDPNYDNGSVVEGQALQPVEGNKYRDIWKVACWRMSEEPRIPMYQKALFGCLSGNLKAVFPACLNWYDYLWAYSRILVDKLTEQEIRANTQSIRPLEELPTDYWDKIPDFEQIFHEMQAIEEIRKESQGYHAVMQKYIILDDVDGLLEIMSKWIQEKDPGLTSHLLRIMAHLVLFFRVIGRSSKEDLCVIILEAYVKELIDQRRIGLVAPYTATLPLSYQVIWYAKFLEGITDENERQLCLKYAEEAELDIPSITKKVVVNVKNKVSEESRAVSSNDTITRAVTTADDEQKISALSWLFFDPSQRLEALKQANSLMRIFVACEKLDAAREIMAKIPEDSVHIITERLSEDEPELTPEEDNTIKEYLCFKAYLEAFDAFNDFFGQLQHGKPVPPPELPAHYQVSLKDKVTHEQLVQEYELEMERWKNTLSAQAKITADGMYNVLLFVGGWMVDQQQEEQIDEERQKQMSLLRRKCIPQITKLLHSVLYNTEQYKESIQIADIIAAEQHGLYKEFEPQELQELLRLFKDSSLRLLGESKDCLGYYTNDEL